jgi:hypothetical protein
MSTSVIAILAETAHRALMESTNTLASVCQAIQEFTVKQTSTNARLIRVPMVAFVLISSMDSNANVQEDTMMLDA